MTASYYDRWYEENRSEISKRRKKKYKTDAKFRAAAQARARASARARAAEHAPAPGRWAEGPAESVMGAKKRLQPRTFTVQGVQVLCFSRGCLLERMGIGDRTAKAWTEKGIIPIATATDSVGRSWYAKSVVDTLGEVIDRGRKEQWTTERLEQETGKALRGE